MALFNLKSVILFTLVGSTLVTSRKVPNWEEVFRDYQSKVVPLRHWGNKSYWMGTSFQATWFEALTFCSQMHMQLLTINSEEENSVIYRYIREASKGFEYWTSGTRLIDGNKWVWFPYGDLIEYTRWSNGQPSDPNGEKCLQVWKVDDNWGLQWNDRPCDVRFHFICERYDSQNQGRGQSIL
ncbi:perlucin [Diabrotica virgifera virgifera]|uniref:Perlucin-like n=1 Tax=Diabrotica virgifera virgifera TaxID=50390 RepID=A0A6P7G4A5_DIAVI|nr:perlucin [Diabrotica virgifera virgifera]